MKTSTQEVEDIIKHCIDTCELFQTDGYHIWSNRVMSNVATRKALSLVRTEAGRKGGAANKSKQTLSKDEQMLSKDEQMLSKDEQMLSKNMDMISKAKSYSYSYSYSYSGVSALCPHSVDTLSNRVSPERRLKKKR